MGARWALAQGLLILAAGAWSGPMIDGVDVVYSSATTAAELRVDAVTVTES